MIGGVSNYDGIGLGIDISHFDFMYRSHYMRMWVRIEFGLIFGVVIQSTESWNIVVRTPKMIGTGFMILGLGFV